MTDAQRRRFEQGVRDLMEHLGIDREAAEEEMSDVVWDDDVAVDESPDPQADGDPGLPVLRRADRG